jgi:hypothetical protein
MTSKRPATLRDVNRILRNCVELTKDVGRILKGRTKKQVDNADRAATIGVILEQMTRLIQMIESEEDGPEGRDDAEAWQRRRQAPGRGRGLAGGA